MKTLLNKKNSAVVTLKIEDDDFKKRLSLFKKEGDMIYCSQMVYVPGDFAGCYNEAQWYKTCCSDFGGYNLLTNNCLDYIVKVALAGTRNFALRAFLKLPHTIPSLFLAQLSAVYGKIVSVETINQVGLLGLRLYFLSEELKKVNTNRC